MKFRQYFDRVSIINLPERFDRRKEMVKELERAGLGLEPGRIEFFPATRVQDAGGFDNPGIRGCFLSHLEVLKEARAGARQTSPGPRGRCDHRAAIPARRRIVGRATGAHKWDIIWLGHTLEKPADRATKLRPYPGPVLRRTFLRC